MLQLGKDLEDLITRLALQGVRLRIATIDDIVTRIEGALHLEFATELFDDAVGNGQAEPGTSESACGRVSELH